MVLLPRIYELNWYTRSNNHISAFLPKPPSPTLSPTPSPTISPTPGPSNVPTVSPLIAPTSSPTQVTVPPTRTPSNTPTVSPLTAPSSSPTQETVSPTGAPSNTPSINIPTLSPSYSPSQSPSITQSNSPTQLNNPTTSPLMILSYDASNVTSFGVDFPSHFANGKFNYGAIGPGCGYDYTNKLIYMFGGVLDSSGLMNPNYATWDFGSNENALKNTRDYADITAPAFAKSFFSSNILTTIPGYTESSGKWYCFESDCTVQINQDPYVYIVSPVVFTGSNAQVATPSMAIFDISTQEYIAPSKYNYTIPGGGKTGN